MKLRVASPAGGLMPPPKTSRGVRVSVNDEEEGSPGAVHAGRCWEPAPSWPGEGSLGLLTLMLPLPCRAGHRLPTLGDRTLLGRRCLWPLVRE